MPLNRSLQDDPTHLGGGGVNADAYLAVVGRKQGTIKGESQTPGHIDEIGVVAWRWGLSSPTDQATGLARGRRVYDPLEVDKLVDGSSTRLLNALANNEGLRSVTLGLRKAGAWARKTSSLQARERARDIKPGAREPERRALRDGRLLLPEDQRRLSPAKEQRRSRGGVELLRRLGRDPRLVTGRLRRWPSAWCCSTSASPAW